MAIQMRAFDQQVIDIDCIHNKVVDRFEDKISSWLWQHFQKRSQKYSQYDKKIQHKNRLFDCLSRYFNYNGLTFANIFFSGSTANGFASLDSDLDLSFVVTDHMYDLSLTKHRKMQILTEIENLLIIHKFKREKNEIIEARVPILRYVDKEFDKENGIKVEINVNNDTGIRNTRLLYCYSKLDWRVGPVCLAIKSWAKDNAIIDSFNGALSSYAVELMVVFYLQNCSPPVLPCLQKTDYQYFSPIDDIMSYEYLPDLSQLKPFESQNKQSLAELYVGFFDYYMNVFDWNRYVISVRLGRPLAKMEYEHYYGDPNQWEFICIEEPFILTNVGRTVYDVNAYNKIVRKWNHWCERYKRAMTLKCLRSRECCCHEDRHEDRHEDEDE